MTTERDLSNQMAYATMIGREEGLEKGLAEGSYAKSVEIAKRLKEIGMSVSEIASVTGLESDAVSEL